MRRLKLFHSAGTSEEWEWGAARSNVSNAR
jgi:hypothetical protein